MKKLPRLSEDAVFFLTAFLVTIAVVIIIGEVTGITQNLINSI